MGKLALILLSGNNTEDSSREIPMGFVCMALTHSPVRGEGPTSSTGVRMTLQRLWAEAEWPWLAGSEWIRGRCALRREFPGPSSFVPDPLIKVPDAL